MVTRIETGKSIRGVLNYNENKVKDGMAQLILASGYPCEPEKLSFTKKLSVFEKLTRQNERTKTNTLHITLNFSPKDRLDKDSLIQIANEYMRGIGFQDQPYLVYQHFDSGHPHLHIATVNIAEGGERIETHNLGKNKSEKTRRAIEKSYGLIKAESQKKEEAYLLKPIDLRRVAYGKQETKQAISNVVREVIRAYKFSSMAEFNAVLNQFGVLADTGAPGSPMHEKGGLVYGLINKKGQRTGVPIKASSIYGRVNKPTLKALNSSFARNKTAKKAFKGRLKFLVNKAIETANTQGELENRLLKKGIRVLFRKNIQGSIFGVTFIDNITKVVFNGRDLDKNLGANKLLERLSEKAIVPINDLTKETGSPLTNEERPQYSDLNQQPGTPITELPVFDSVVEILLSDEHEANEFAPYRKKRKKRILPD